MRFLFWRKAAVMPSGPSGECVHLWSNWSEPEACEVATYSLFSGGDNATRRDGLKQDRKCLHCNMYERRLA